MSANQRGGSLSRRPYDDGIEIAAFGGSWVCNHIPWRSNDGLMLLPLPLDAPVVVLDIRNPVDLDVVDRDRLRDQLATMVDGMSLQGAAINRPTLHECFRTARSVVYVVRLRPPAMPQPGAGVGVAFDATVM